MSEASKGEKNYLRRTSLIRKHVTVFVHMKVIMMCARTYHSLTLLLRDAYMQVSLLLGMIVVMQKPKLILEEI